MPSISKTVTIDNVEYTVTRINIIGTKLNVYSAWVGLTDHMTRTHDDNGKALGKVGSEPIATKIKSNPNMNVNDVHMHYEQRYDVAYIAILQAFGEEAAYGKCNMGEVTVIAE